MWGGCPASKEYVCITPLGNFFQDYAVTKMFQNSFINKLSDIYGVKNFFGFTNDMDDSGKTALDYMKKNPNELKDGGAFIMIHMMVPHTIPPYREPNCFVTDKFKTPASDGYKSSVFCALNRIHEISDFIIKNYPESSIIVQSDHGIFIDENKKNQKFIEHSDKFIDFRLGAFTAVKGCNSEIASKLNQTNIVEYVVECLITGKSNKKFLNNSFFGFYENSPEYGKVYRVDYN